MILPIMACWKAVLGIPRESGDDPDEKRLREWFRGYSPRERG